jgi:hypothetical protein
MPGRQFAWQGRLPHRGLSFSRPACGQGDKRAAHDQSGRVVKKQVQ